MIVERLEPDGEEGAFHKANSLGEVYKDFEPA